MGEHAAAPRDESLAKESRTTVSQMISEVVAELDIQDDLFAKLAMKLETVCAQSSDIVAPSLARRDEPQSSMGVRIKELYDRVEARNRQIRRITSDLEI